MSDAVYVTARAGTAKANSAISDTRMQNETQAHASRTNKL